MKWLILTLPCYISPFFFSSFLFAFFDLTSVITSKMDALLTLTHYDVYLDSDYLLSNNKKVNIVMFFQYILYCFFILFRNDVALFYEKDKQFEYIYDIFFISACLFFVLFRSLIMVRILRYFISFEFIIIGYYFNYLVQSRYKSYRHLIFYSYIFFFLMSSYYFFIKYSEISTGAYVSYFQTDLYNQKEIQRANFLNQAN